MSRLVKVLWLFCQVISAYSQNPAVCLSWDSRNCLGGNATLTRNGIWLTSSGSSVKQWFNSEPSAQIISQNITNDTEYSIVQPEHGGGSCNCLYICFTSNCSLCSENVPSHQRFRLCGGSASLPRRKKIIFYSLESINETSVEDIEKKAKPFNVTCDDTTPHIEVSFSLFLNENGNCNTINEFNEGIEFSISFSSKSEEWIPIRFIYPLKNVTESDDIFIGDKDNLVLRGYRVEDEGIYFTESIAEKNVTIRLCDFERSDYFQFRWLQTSQHRTDDYPRDVWSLYDVRIDLLSSEQRVKLINESFDSSTIDSTNWPMDHVRNGDILDYCTREGGRKALVFGHHSCQEDCNKTISSRSLLTNKLPLCEFFFNVNGTSETFPEGLPSPSTTSSSGEFSTGEGTTAELIPPFKLIDEQKIRDQILANRQLKEILDSRDFGNSLDLLLSVSRMEGIDAAVVVYLLASIVNVINVSSTIEFSDPAIEAALDVGNAIIQLQPSMTNTFSMLVGTSLLLSYDTLLLNLLPKSEISVRKNIALHAQLVNVNTIKDGYFTAINTSDILRPDVLHTSMEIPIELLRMFADDDGRVRVTSSVHMNVIPLFPDGLATKNESRLVSDIVSSSVQCGMEICSTNNLNLLSSPIRINLEHSKSLKEELSTNGSVLEVICVFLDVSNSSRSVLSLGRWSTRGCKRNDKLSSTSITVCECNHLTHFGILLSARPPKSDRPEAFSLIVINYVGTALSVFSMTLVVLTFIMLKSLHSTRNYIHVNLCINLSIAQLISVAGLDRADPNGDVVPIHCQVVAVLLQYFLLVSFMWMLMEGIILYVVLVRVFVDLNKRYRLAFTLTSYGAPLLYMGLLTLPLGFAPNRELQYGNKYACFLKWETNFIFAFISPVVLIFLANIAFFIMAAKITWRHQMKQGDQKNLQNVRSWMKSVVSLMVVMGMTWIPSLLVVDVGLKKAGTVLEYISTFLVAFQGVFIFLIFVVFSKAVREAYVKWWKSKVNESEVLSKYFGENITLTTSKSQTYKTQTSKKSSEQTLDILESGKGAGMEWTTHNGMNQYSQLQLIANTNKKTDLGSLDSIDKDKECPAFVKEEFSHFIKNDSALTFDSTP